MSSTPSINQEELLTRGVAQVLPDSASLLKKMKSQPIKVFMGIDPTGNSLHLGHSVGLRKLNQFAQAGHEVILLIGNGTVRIGDPTGRDSSRPVLTDEQIESNFNSWKSQAEKVLDFSKITIVRNGDWLDKLTYTDIVKLMAQTTVQQLIERDMFQDRLKKNLPIFGHEIMYPLLQGYDSVAMNVDLEIGGTDQTFNMMMGRQLQRSYNNHEKWVLTTPIINGSDGRKMGKSFGNFISLTEDPTNMYGKLMSVSDEVIVDYFRLLTDVPTVEIESMEKEMKSGTNPMEYKKKLAFTITSGLHSEELAASAQTHFESTVQNKEVGDATALTVPKESSLLDIIKLAQPELSNNEVRRLIEQGGVSLDGEKKTDPQEKILTTGTLKVGKRQFYSISFVA